MAYHKINTDSPSNNPNNNNGNNNGPSVPGSGNGTPSNNGGNANNSNNGGSGNLNATSNPNLFKPGNSIPETLIDYDELATNNEIHKVQFRDNIIKRLLTTLTTTNHPNALLVGEAGTGKTAIVEDLAVRLHEQDPITTAMLGDKTKIYELPLNNLVAGSSMQGALEAKVKEVIDFINDPKNHAILYIDEIHQLMTNHNLRNVAEILKPALARGKFRTIGSTTTQELKFWNQNPALNRRFSNIIVDELTDEQTIEILNKALPRLQKNKTTVQVDSDLLKNVVYTGNQYAKTLSTHRPDSAITILDQSLAIARLQSIELKQTAKLKVAPKISIATIKQAGKQLLNDDSKQISQQTVSDLKQQLDKSIVGQDKAKQTLIKATQSMVLNLVPSTKPHSFLFAGLTGTGKTEMAKQLAKVIFGSTDRYIYLNMTEFANRGSITSLIGSSRGYIGSDSAQPLPLDALKSNPTQIVLLDEFEKADMQVRKLFMQALDEGTLKYADGSTVDFSHAIVIATTNAGTQKFDEKHVGFGPAKSISHNDLNQALTKSFPPELLNRFANIVSFNAISKAEYKEVLVIKYNQLIQNISKQHPEFDLEPQTASTDMQFIQKIADKTYDKMKNARPANRSVQSFIESEILKNPRNTQFNFEPEVEEDVEEATSEPQSKNETTNATKESDSDSKEKE